MVGDKPISVFWWPQGRCARAESSQFQDAAEEGADGLLSWVWASICTANELMRKVAQLLAPSLKRQKAPAQQNTHTLSQGRCGYRGLS